MAKVKCNHVLDYGNVKQVELGVLTSKPGDSPYGNVNLTINEGTTVFDLFKPGKDYNLTIDEEAE